MSRHYTKCNLGKAVNRETVQGSEGGFSGAQERNGTHVDLSAEHKLRKVSIKLVQKIGVVHEALSLDVLLSVVLTEPGIAKQEEVVSF